jgi:hypothetical protein
MWGEVGMRRLSTALAICLLSFLLGSPLVQFAEAQDSDPALAEKIEALQKQLDALKAELAAKTSASPSSGAAPVSPTVAVANLAESSVPAHPTVPSIASILGPVTLSGFVDTYYGVNFNHPANRINGLRSFDGGANQFGLNMVELVLDKAPNAESSRTGYRVALGFGQAMNAVNASDPGGLGFGQYLKEAYFSYLAPVGKGLQVDVGKFVTPNGAEVIETKDNWNYSRGILFSYAIPYYHFGLRAKYAFNDKVALTGFLVNGWNNVVDNNTGKTYGVSLGLTPNKKFAIYQNYMIGAETDPTGLNTNKNLRQLSDTVIGFYPTPKLSLLFNYDYGRGDRVLPDQQAGLLSKPVYWTGIAGYVKYALNDKYSVATRYEYYNDKDGFTTGTAQHFNGITGTLERTIASRIITRMEYRRDASNRPFFIRGASSTSDHQDTFTAGLIFTFDSKEGAN